MKNTLQKIAIAMAMCLFMIFAGCQKDDDIPVPQQTPTHKTKFKTITFDEFKKNEKVFAEFQKATGKENITKSREYGDGYYYHTEEITVIEYNDGRYNYKSYIFPMYRDTITDYVENLLIWEKSSGEIDSFIVEYNLTGQEKEDILNGKEIFNLQDKTRFKKTSGDAYINGIRHRDDGTCYEISFYDPDTGDYVGDEGIYYEIDVLCPEGYEDLSLTEGGGGSGSSSAPIVVYYPSDGGGDPGNGPITGHPGAGTGDAGGGHNPVLTSPLIDLPTQVLKNVFGLEALSIRNYPNLKLALFYCIITNPSEEVNMIAKKIKEFAFLDTNKNVDAAVKLLEYLKENNNSAESIQIAEEVIGLYNEDLQNGDADVNIMHMTLVALKGNYFNQPFDGDYYNAIDPYTEENLQASTNWPGWHAYFTAHCAMVRFQHSQWSNFRVYWEVSKEMIHIGLDVVGLVPVVGEVADLINGAIYTIEGDGLNATLSYASAIPVAGWAAAGIKIAKVSGGLFLTTKSAVTLVSFGSYNSRKFRKLCGIAVGDLTKHAHHILPRASIITSHPVVQRATQVLIDGGFSIDKAMNGIAVAAWRNQPNHNNYNNRIYNKLQDYITEKPNATPLQCCNKLKEIIQETKVAIINNPNVHLNNLIF